MTEFKRQTDALLTDHFTYTPLSLIDDIINAVNAIVYHALDTLEDGLLSVPPQQLGFQAQSSTSNATNGPVTPRTNTIPDPDNSQLTELAKAEIENGVHSLETLLESTVDRNFDKFEIWTLRNILSVPEDLASWIRLSHYENLSVPSSIDAPTPDSIQQLRRQLAESRKMNLMLKTTQAQNTTLLTQLHALLSPTPSEASTDTSNLAFLTSSARQESSTSTSQQTAPSVKTQSEFLVSQLPHLRALVTSLRPKLAHLAQMDVENLNWESHREARRAYVEKGAQRAIQRAGGASGSLLDMGTGGSGIDHESRRSQADVEELEALIGRGAAS